MDECRNPLGFNPDNSQVLVTGWVCEADPPDGVATESEVIDLDSGESIVSLPYRAVFSGEFNPNGVFPGGSYLVATDQFSVEAWDLQTKESIGRLERTDLNEAAFFSVHFDPTGRYVVGGTAGGRVWVLDMEQVVAGTDMVDALVFSEQAHTGAAPAPALSADGIVGSAGFADGAIRLWNLDSGELLFEFEADVGQAPVVRFTPDGSHLLYPHGLSIRSMPVDPHQLRGLAGELLTRDFLPDECPRYARPERCETVENG